MVIEDIKLIYTDTYTVQKGESLLKIAMQFGVKLNELAYINNIYSENIFPNQVRYHLPLIIKILKVPNKDKRDEFYERKRKIALEQ